jgi:hypothetical protein
LELSPALEAICERLKGVGPDRVDDEVRRATVDLLLSDIPLDRNARDWIAGMLQSFLNTHRAAQEKWEVDRYFDASLKRFLQKRGMTATKADEQIADVLKVSVSALKKRRQRPPK